MHTGKVILKKFYYYGRCNRGLGDIVPFTFEARGYKEGYNKNDLPGE